jgi:hypothetical protein
MKALTGLRLMNVLLQGKAPMTDKVEIISHKYRKIKGKYYARIRYKIDDGKPLSAFTDFVPVAKNGFA